MRIKAFGLAALLLSGFVLTPQAIFGSDPPAAPANGQHADTAQVADAHGADDHAAKPALLEWDLGSAVWSIVVFVILLVILRKAAWGPILGALHNREKFITDSLETARREREEAKKLMAQYAAQIEKARADASAIVEEGRKDAEEVRRRIHGEAQAEAEALVTRARKDIEVARNDAVKQLYDHGIELATRLAGKIVARQLTPADHRALLDESLGEIEKISSN